MHQRDHSETIAPIRKSVGCVVMLLELMRLGGDEYLLEHDGKECLDEFCGDGSALIRPL